MEGEKVITWFIVFCVVFIVTVITITLVLVQKAKREVIPMNYHHLNGRPKTLWEEEEEDSIA